MGAPVSRPRIAIPARFSQSASALRFRAVVAARALAAAVYAAGGDPVVLLPVAAGGVADDDEVADRLGFADGVLLPGGGDLSPEFYGAKAHASLYDMDAEQDAFDIAVARWAIAAQVPLLAICRGMQVVNVVRGGDLIQDMPTHHRHVVSELDLAPGTVVRAAVGRDRITISCYHHQALGRLGDGLVATSTSDDGVVESVEFSSPDHAWFLGLQWHPEDHAATDPAQRAVFEALVGASRA